MDWFCVFCYGDEENARIYAVHLTTANQSEIRRAYLVSVCRILYCYSSQIMIFNKYVRMAAGDKRQTVIRNLHTILDTFHAVGDNKKDAM